MRVGERRSMFALLPRRETVLRFIVKHVLSRAVIERYFWQGFITEESRKDSQEIAGRGCCRTGSEMLAGG